MLPGQVFLDASTYTAKAHKRKILLPPQREAETVIYLHWTRADVLPFVPDTVCDSPTFVEVNRARWIVGCECGAAQFASRTDHRMLCMQCLNESGGGAWRPVVWPDDPDGIEAALRPRLTENANWTHNETIADLVAENVVMGVQ